MADTPSTGVMPPPPATMTTTTAPTLTPKQQVLKRILDPMIAGEKPKGFFQAVLYMAYKKGKIPWLQPGGATNAPAPAAQTNAAPQSPVSSITTQPVGQPVPAVDATLPTDTIMPEGIAPGEPNPTAPQTPTQQVPSFGDAFRQRTAQVAPRRPLLAQAPITGGVGRFRG